MIYGGHLVILRCKIYEAVMWLGCGTQGMHAKFWTWENCHLEDQEMDNINLDLQERRLWKVDLNWLRFMSSHKHVGSV